MADLDRLLIRYRQFGGLRLAAAYIRMGLLFPILKALVRCTLRGTSYKSVYGVVRQRVCPLLVSRYSPLIDSLAARYSVSPAVTPPVSSASPAVVWFCWLQGMASAPPLVHACLRSLRRSLAGTAVVVIDENNYTRHVTLPAHVTERYAAGKIPPALFSDMLRLQLLATHGGVWIDSTVYCTMPDTATRGRFAPSWQQILAAPLFLFQYTRPGEAPTGNISNWFIASHPRHPLVLILRDILFSYWADHDITLDYYIFHLFFRHICQRYPHLVGTMPYGWSEPCLELGSHLSETFSAARWQRFTSRVHWHKMTYRLKPSVTSPHGTYYQHLISPPRPEGPVCAESPETYRRMTARDHQTVNKT